jgi:hypothetical protein
MWTPRASALVLIGVAAQSLVLDGWQVFEARTVPLAVAMLVFAVALVAGADAHRSAARAHGLRATVRAAARAFRWPRVERPPTRDPDVLHDERCEGDCGGCRVSRGVN